MHQIGSTLQDHVDFVSQFLLGKRSLARRIQAKRAVQDINSHVDEHGFPIPEERLLTKELSYNYTVHSSPTILICGHNSRDTRCGVLGPILREGFESYIIGQLRPYFELGLSGIDSEEINRLRQIRYTRVALTSHIGGHSFAGNVIIYLPKDFMTPNGIVSPLAGSGIWYGRVEPRHVRGIMEETLQRGNLIEDLLRGIRMRGSWTVSQGSS